MKKRSDKGVMGASGGRRGGMQVSLLLHLDDPPGTLSPCTAGNGVWGLIAPRLLLHPSLHTGATPPPPPPVTSFRVP